MSDPDLTVTLTWAEGVAVAAALAFVLRTGPDAATSSALAKLNAAVVLAPPTEEELRHLESE
jgi:hypothetical protein